MTQTKIDILNFLTQFFLFENLSGPTLALFAESASSIRVKKGDHIFWQDKKAEAFYLIAYGKFCVYRLTPQGDERIMHFLKDREMIAEAAAFSSGVYPASCQALKEGLVIAIPTEILISQIRENPELGLQMLAGYSKRLREFVGMVEFLSVADVNVRMARFFVKNTIRHEGKYFLNADISKKEMAQFLSITPETVSRVLKKWKTSLIIQEDSGQIALLNFDYLLNLAES